MTISLSRNCRRKADACADSKLGLRSKPEEGWILRPKCPSSAGRIESLAGPSASLRMTELGWCGGERSTHSATLSADTPPFAKARRMGTGILVSEGKPARFARCPRPKSGHGAPGLCKLSPFLRLSLGDGIRDSVGGRFAAGD